MSAMYHCIHTVCTHACILYTYILWCDGIWCSVTTYMLNELLIKRTKVAMMQLHLVGYTVCL